MSDLGELRVNGQGQTADADSLFRDALAMRQRLSKGTARSWRRA